VRAGDEMWRLSRDFSRGAEEREGSASSYAGGGPRGSSSAAARFVAERG
jgi:hypothetical protein